MTHRGLEGARGGVMLPDADGHVLAPRQQQAVGSRQRKHLLLMPCQVVLRSRRQVVHLLANTRSVSTLNLQQ